jgi:hypothetical protein
MQWEWSTLAHPDYRCGRRRARVWARESKTSRRAQGITPRWQRFKIGTADSGQPLFLLAIFSKSLADFSRAVFLDWPGQFQSRSDVPEDGELYTGTNEKPFISHSSGEDYASHFAPGAEFTVRVKPGHPSVSIVAERDQTVSSMPSGQTEGV